MTHLPFLWNGEHMVPRNPRAADRAYVVGQSYVLEDIEERSAASHAHFFAVIRDSWMSLPDALSAEYPSPVHLRKKMLIRAGYADERSIVCASKAEAQRIAAFIRPMDDYAIVDAREAVVRVFTAKSQSMKAMGKADFQASKTAVLEAINDLLGIKAAA